MINIIWSRLNFFLHKVNLFPLFDLIKTLFLPVIMSLFGSVLINVIALLVSIYVVYFVYSKRQESLFELSKTEATFIVQMPMYFLFSIWGLGLFAVSDDVARIGLSLLTDVVFLVFVSILPLYRKNKNWEIKRRKISYESIYFITCFLVVLHQFIVIVEYG